jgi:hypothetical protein
MRSAIERLPPPWSPRVRQGHDWRRAHSLVLEGRTKEAALAYAEKARSELAALARKSGERVVRTTDLDLFSGQARRALNPRAVPLPTSQLTPAG